MDIRYILHMYPKRYMFNDTYMYSRIHESLWHLTHLSQVCVRCHKLSCILLRGILCIFAHPTHCSAWPDPRPASEAQISAHLPLAPKSPGPEFQNYERLVTQRDAKIGILQKQVCRVRENTCETSLAWNA